MANNIVINSKFKPFSYLEMILPVMMADLELKNIETSLSDLNAKASIWNNLANELTDPKAFKMYKEYSTSLQQQSDSLAASGLTPDSRRAMLDLRSRYSSDIVPIELAYTRRKELADELRKMQAQNPSIIYDRNMANTSLDAIIDNPSMQPQSISGALLTLQVGQAAANLKKQMQQDLVNNPLKAGLWRSILGGQLFERVIRDGFSQEDIMAAMQGKGPKVLTDLVTNTVAASGVQNWNNPQATQQALYYAHQGLYNAIGDYKIDRVNNKEYDYLLSLRLATAKAKPKKEIDSNPLPYTIIPRASVTPLNLPTVDAANKDMLVVANLLKNPNLMKVPLGKSDTGLGDMARASYNYLVKQIAEKYNISEASARQRRAESNPFFASQNQMLLNLDRLDINLGVHSPRTARFYLDELPRLLLKYGAKNINELQSAINNVQKSNATILSDFAVDFADMGVTKDAIQRKILARLDGTGVWETKSDGSKSRNSISGKDVVEMFKNAEPGFLYDSNLNEWTIRALDGDDTKSYIIDSRIIDPTGGLENYKKALNTYKEKLRSGLALTNREVNDMNRIYHTMMMEGTSYLNNIHKAQNKSGDEKGEYSTY